MILALLLLQAVAGPPLPPELRKPARRSSAPCPAQVDGGDIVVCGRSTDQRLGKLPERPPTRAFQDAATFRLPGGGTGNVHGFQTVLPGAISQGAAVTVKLPFGKKAKPADR